MDGLSEALENDHTDSRDLRKVGKKVRKLILEAEFPEDLSKAIVEAYRKLGGLFNPSCPPYPSTLHSNMFLCRWRCGSAFQCHGRRFTRG
jgi:Pyruvate phosphate dikinase, AMP/ATP-binding domain